MATLTNTFGKLVKRLRSNLTLGLREFCIAADLDPSNWSKVERGLLSPPDPAKLEVIASTLKLRPGSDDWQNLFDYAALDQGKIPQDIMNDQELLQKLPVFFRTARGKKPTAKELEQFYNILKKG